MTMTELHAVPVDPAGHETPLLVIPVFQSGDDTVMPPLPDTLRERIRAGRDPGDLKGKPGTSLLIHLGIEDGPRRVLLLGLGEESKVDPEGLRRFAGHAVRKAEELGIDRITLYLPETGVDAGRAARCLAEGGALAAWRFRELKTGRSGADQGEEITEVTAIDLMVAGEAASVERGSAAGAVLARAANFARTLQSRPGNVATPTHLADEATRMAEEVGLEVRVFGPDRLREERMNAILAVSAGSDQEPRLIVLEHRGGAEGARPLVLVGKGLTFDAGGISIKPAKGMEDMKYDMSGGAAVLGAMRAVAELGLPVNVVGIVPSSENLLGGRAQKPGDVIHTRSGKTVEVTNTDAEGRLILADALDYAAGMDPEAMVDCATLTGAVVVGLGHHASGLLGNDEVLIEELRRAGDAAGERCWPLPLWDEYRKQLRSETADLNNVGGRPAGAITAACFLSEFVGTARWAHLDIAGTAYGTEPLPYQRKGGYGTPTRLLVEWVRSRAG